MDKKTKGFLIDFGILSIWGVILLLFLYFGYGHIFKTRLVAVIILILNIPICWGTIIMSILGKKTIGHRIISKKDMSKTYGQVN